MRPLPIPNLHDWRKMEVCLINFNKGKDDEGCLKFCTAIFWNGVQLCKENNEGLFRKLWGPMLQPIEPICKSGTADMWSAIGLLQRYSVEFTYRLDRLKSRASRFRGPPAKLHNFFNTVIGLSHLCYHSVLYFLNNPSVIFLT